MQPHRRTFGLLPMLMTILKVRDGKQPWCEVSTIFTQHEGSENRQKRKAKQQIYNTEKHTVKLEFPHIVRVFLQRQARENQPFLGITHPVGVVGLLLYGMHTVSHALAHILELRFTIKVDRNTTASLLLQHSIYCLDFSLVLIKWVIINIIRVKRIIYSE